MPEKNRKEFAERHDTDFAYEIAGLARFRSNVFADRRGPGAVFRVIPSKILTAEQLGLSPHILQLCALNKGLVLVTGPTGSGKSTTLCAMIDHINQTRQDHIITIEDPIEFVHDEPEVPDQPARGPHAHRLVQGRAARGAARRSRHHPGRRAARPRDGGDRDRNRRNRPSGVRHAAHDDRGVDRRPRSSISSRPTGRRRSASCCRNRCAGVIAQTLCRKIGGGRVAALEVLIATQAVSNLIREGKTFQIPSIMQVSKADRHGEPQRRADGAGDQEARRRRTRRYAKAVDKAGFDALLKRAGINVAPPADPRAARPAAAGA